MVPLALLQQLRVDIRRLENILHLLEGKHIVHRAGQVCLPASAFLAMQGPTKMVTASGCSFFTVRPAAIIGDTAPGTCGISS